jgi:hypothetical protein
MISANADITPKWKAGVSTGYDFVQKELHLHNFALKRDLLELKWILTSPLEPMPIGFFIGIKSGVLSDIKWDKRSTINR